MGLVILDERYVLLSETPRRHILLIKKFVFLRNLLSQLRNVLFESLFPRCFEDLVRFANIFIAGCIFMNWTDTTRKFYISLIREKLGGVLNQILLVDL